VGRALTRVQVPMTASIQGQSARKCSQRLRWPRVSRAGRSNRRKRRSLTEASRRPLGGESQVAVGGEQVGGQ